MNDTYGRIGNIAAKTYAVLVLLSGLFFAFLALVFSRAMHVSEATVYPLTVALFFLVPGIFIWRGALWAMILVAAGTLGLVVYLLIDAYNDHANDHRIWIVMPVVFAALTALFIGCRIKSRPV